MGYRNGSKTVCQTLRSVIGVQAFGGRSYFCATVGQRTEEMIKEYAEHHFEPNPNDDFKMESDQNASFSRRVSGLSVHNTNPPALAGGCLVPGPRISSLS